MSGAESRLGSAERQVELIEQQSEMIANARDAQLEQAQAALEAQLEQADAWREAQLSLLNEIANHVDPAQPMAAAGGDNGAQQQREQITVSRQHLDETKQMRAELTAMQGQQRYTQDLVLSLLRKWDEDGLPPGRENTDDADDGSIAYVIGYEAA
jgi:small-conductance mechanosensitive channel